MRCPVLKQELLCDARNRRAVLFAACTEMSGRICTPTTTAWVSWLARSCSSSWYGPPNAFGVCNASAQTLLACAMRPHNRVLCPIRVCAAQCVASNAQPNACKV
eukprot:907213-Rhodomonas_salina.3